MTDKEKLTELLTDNLDGCDNPLQMCMDECWFRRHYTQTES